jgi:uncharacterized protein YutD
LGAPDVWESAPFSSIFLASSFSCSQALSTPAHTQVTQTVETVEKVTFQKMIFEKWDRNTEKHLVFCVLSNILAIFEPVVGDFYEHFSNKGFFDSLVRQPSYKDVPQ